MAIKNSSDIKGVFKQEIDLSGPDGNAYALMAIGKNFARQLDIDFNPIRKDMMSGDYENLIQVFDNNFGDYVDLVRANAD